MLSFVKDLVKEITEPIVMSVTATVLEARQLIKYIRLTMIVLVLNLVMSTLLFAVFVFWQIFK